MPIIILAAALAVLAAAATVFAAREHRRLADTRQWLESVDDELGRLGADVHNHGDRLKAHTAIQDTILKILEAEYPAPAPIAPATHARPALPEGWSVVDGASEPSTSPRRATLTVVAG